MQSNAHLYICDSQLRAEDNSAAAIEARAAQGLNYSHFGIRLTGQDSERGTFNQRHAVTYDTRTRRHDAHTHRVHPQQVCACRCT